MRMSDTKWYQEGLRFECISCSNCCVTHGEYAYVYVAEKDIAAISNYLGLHRSEFLTEFCVQYQGLTYLREEQAECRFLEGKQCRIYPVRPKQCETWPFWTGNLERRVWEGAVADCCPGVGQGKRYTKDEIEAIARERDEWYGL